MNSGASVRLIDGDRGRFKAKDVENSIKDPENVHYPLTKLVTVENTSNRGGGSFWDLNDIREINKICKANRLKFHLDGARIINALAETNESPIEYGNLFDSISICLSKGLGAPVGSLLIGDSGFIKKARRVRKVLGGGMRQIGYLASAGIYALDNHIERLKDDHRRAKEIGAVLQNLPYVKELYPVDTNIIIFKLSGSITDKDFTNKLLENNIKALLIGGQEIRMVTHLNFDNEMLDSVIASLKSV